MEYIQPNMTLGIGDDVAQPYCTPGIAVAVAVAAAVWNVAGVYNYVGVAVTAGVVLVAFVAVGTSCTS